MCVCFMFEDDSVNCTPGNALHSHVPDCDSIWLHYRNVQRLLALVCVHLDTLTFRSTFRLGATKKSYRFARAQCPIVLINAEIAHSIVCRACASLIQAFCITALGEFVKPFLGFVCCVAWHVMEGVCVVISYCKSANRVI